MEEAENSGVLLLTKHEFERHSGRIWDLARAGSSESHQEIPRDV